MEKSEIILFVITLVTLFITLINYFYIHINYNKQINILKGDINALNLLLENLTEQKNLLYNTIEEKSKFIIELQNELRRNEMDNRHLLGNKNIYDFLCDLNETLSKEDPSCILTLLHAKEYKKDVSWCEKFSNCEECIQTWLNTEEE